MLKFTFTFCLILFTTLLFAQEPALKWMQAVQGTDDAISNAVAQDGYGNVYTTGTFSGTADFDPSNATYNLSATGQRDIYISKMDKKGRFVWAKKIGSIGFDESVAIAYNSDAKIYVTGYFTDMADFDPDPNKTYNLSAVKGSDIFISKFDTSGNLIWARSMGGNYQDVGSGIAVDYNGFIYACGYFRDTAYFDPGHTIKKIATKGNDSTNTSDIFVLKMDTAGNIVWAKTMGGSENDEAYGIAFDNNIILTGSFEDTADFDPDNSTYNLVSNGATDIFVLAMDDKGQLVWSKQIGGAFADAGTSIFSRFSGNVFLTGYFYDAVDFDPGPGTTNLTASGNRDAFVLFIGNDGTFGWAKQLGGPSDDAGTSIAADGSFNVYTTGSYRGTADFNPAKGTAGNYPLTAEGKNDIFISKLNIRGEFVWAQSVGGESIDIPTDIAIDLYDNVYLGGYFSGTADFDPGAGTELHTASSYDAFTLKLTQCPAFITITFHKPGELHVAQYLNATFQWVDCDNNNQPIAGETNYYYKYTKEGRYAAIISIDDCSAITKCFDTKASNLLQTSYDKQTVYIYPNPTSKTAELYFQSNLAENTIHIINSMGQVMQTIYSSESSVPLDLQALSNGIYTIVVEGISEKVKLVKL